MNTWTAKLLAKLKTLPELQDVATDQQNNGSQVELVIDRSTASRLGITLQMIDDTLYDAFGQRQVSTMFTQLNQYHVVLEVDPEFQSNPRALRDIYLTSPTGRLGTAEHFRPLRTEQSAVDREPSGAVSGSHDFVQCGARLFARRRGNRDRRGPEARSGCRPASQTAFQGTAQAFQASLSNEPILILAALITVYIVLGVLYESYIHPITILSTLPSAGVGAILALLIYRQRSQRDRAHRHHPADRYRQEERHHDRRLRPGGRSARKASPPAKRSTRRACCAFGRS